MATIVPTKLTEIEEIRKDCQRMVVKRALVSGAANLVPVPGADIAVDIGLMMELLPAINRRFGLSPEQIDQLDPQSRMLVYNLVVKLGSETAGKVITKKIVINVLKKVGVKVTAKQVAKYIPLVGQAAAFTISAAAIKYVCDAHINECYSLSQKILETKKSM